MLDVRFLEELNKKVKFLNDERQKLIGKRDAAREAFEKSLKEYNEKYGVTLQESNLEEELKKVELELQQQANELVQKIQEIESKLNGNQSSNLEVPNLQNVGQVNTPQSQSLGYSHVQQVFQPNPQQSWVMQQGQGVFQSVDKTVDVEKQASVQPLQWGVGVVANNQDNGKPFTF